MSATVHDAVVVGAGIVGLATALEWLQRRPGSRVLVVDKEDHHLKVIPHNRADTHRRADMIPMLLLSTSSTPLPPRTRPTPAATRTTKATRTSMAEKVTQRVSVVSWAALLVQQQEATAVTP